MEKKLTAQGPKDRKSYTVTLPLEWVKKEGLDKAKVVELSVVGNKAIISASKLPEQKVTFNGDFFCDNLIKVLQELYRKGVDEIEVKFKDTKVVSNIMDILDKYLIGYEIVQQKKDFIIIREITKESEEDFKVIFRRIFLLVLELAECDDEVQVNALERNIKKLINYCQRILMKKGHAEFQKVPIYYVILDRLEKLSDEYRWLAQLKETKIPFKQEINVILRNAYELFYKFDNSIYAEFQYKTYLLRKEVKLKDKINRQTIHVHNIIRILNTLYSDIFGLKYGEDN